MSSGKLESDLPWPVFRDGWKQYVSDRCEPLERAIADGSLALSAVARMGYPGTELSDNSLAGVCTLGYWDARKSQNWGLDWHRNEGLEIAYLAKGKLDFLVKDETFLLQPGQLTITRPWQRHKLGNPNINASRLYWLIIDVDVRRPNAKWKWPNWLILNERDREALSNYLKHNETPVFEGNKEIESCFERIAKILDRTTTEDKANRLKLYMNELFVILLELLAGANLSLDAHLSSSLRTVEYFLDELPKCLDYEWSVDGMAEECGLARSRFTYYCRKITNLSPLDYLTQLRLRHAIRLLVETDSSLQEIAKACGFQSARYFTTKFGKITGCSPSSYRRNQRGCGFDLPQGDNNHH